MPLTQLQTQFSDFLVSLWQVVPALKTEESIRQINADCETTYLNRQLWHKYQITNSSVWNEWRNGNGDQERYLGERYRNLRSDYWWCNSLSEAADHYSWSNGSLVEFSQLSAALQNALRLRDAALTHSLCLAVFRWGGVAKRANDASRIWLDDALHAGTLINGIIEAVAALKPSSECGLEPFANGRLLMNSAMTKVYSASDNSGEVAIYDGRVGGALGLLARLFLESVGKFEVPDELDFLWGYCQTTPRDMRDPSCGLFKFKELRAHGVTNLHRARVSRLTNAIFQSIQASLLKEKLSTSSREIEKALFMIGRRVKS